ncbi:MFS transporter [Bacillus sp. FJAT-49736]|uniref:MFS transporter n=1 Tax=Bacillus sp. FJAT-49736 TaxID=2833582 RepID=UPI001BCA3FFE|nr:MFS transporter [Bacillus sp. FJAT-49736]MBS4175585.1 MFS transporter [Bacillus sp. FJAT-49736]
MDSELKLKKATYHLWTFTISKLIGSFGAQVYSFAISFYILQLTGSATNFAANLLCSILPRTLAGPFAGYVSDNFPRKTIAITSQIVQTVAIGVLLTVCLTSDLSLIAIYITTCVLSLTSTFSGVNFTSSITGLIDEARIQKAMSLNQMSISFAAIGSPVVGGLLYGIVSMPVFLIIYMIASGIAVILESTMNFKLFANRKTNGEGKKKEPIWQSMKSGIAYLKLNPLITTVIWIALLVNFFFGAHQVGYSFILIDRLKIDSQHFGLTEGAFAIGMLILSFYFSFRKEVKYPLLLSKRGIIALGILMSGIALPLIIKMSYSWLIIFYMVLMIGFGALIILINTPMQVMLQKQIDDDYKGRVFSIIETMAQALSPLAMVLYGFLYDFIPAQWILMVSALFLIGVVMILARPSVIRKAHPEWGENGIIKEKAPAIH